MFDVSHAPVGLETLPKTFAESPYAAFAGRAMVSAAPAWRRDEEEDLKSVFRFARADVARFFGRADVALGRVGSIHSMDGDRSAIPGEENPLKVCAPTAGRAGTRARVPGDWYMR